MRRNDIMAVMDAEVLTGRKKDILTKVFVAFVALFAVFCIGVMNSKYDSLSRYPYKDRQSREKIKQYLTKEEIQYIIEYSIPPNMFIAFIEEKGFSIYHAAEYKKLSEYAWQESPAAIVRMVEETRNDMTVDDLILFLGHYQYDELHSFLVNGDHYSPGTDLVANAGNTDCWLDQQHTVSVRKPGNLQVLDEAVPNGTDHDIFVAETIQEPLKELCGAAEKNFRSGQGCGGLEVMEGYVSYEQQEERYLASDKTGNTVSFPGHDEHQLGLAVDFGISGISEEYEAKCEQNEWLRAHAGEFGFVMTYGGEDGRYEPMHWRYIGADLAAQLKEQGITFAAYGKAQYEKTPE